MKIRINYVSNSSASSYIIGVANIKKEFEKQVEEFVNNASRYLFEIKEGDDDFISNESFNYDSVSNYIPKGEKALVFYDTADVEVNDDGEIISEPEIEDFDKDIVSIMNNKDWFKDIEFKMGTGFNG